MSSKRRWEPGSRSRRAGRSAWLKLKPWLAYLSSVTLGVAMGIWVEEQEDHGIWGGVVALPVLYALGAAFIASAAFVVARYRILRWRHNNGTMFYLSVLFAEDRKRERYVDALKGKDRFDGDPSDPFVDLTQRSLMLTEKGAKNNERLNKFLQDGRYDNPRYVDLLPFNITTNMQWPACLAMGYYLASNEPNSGPVVWHFRDYGRRNRYVGTLWKSLWPERLLSGQFIDVIQLSPPSRRSPR